MSYWPVTTALFADLPGLTDQSFADGTYSVEVKNLTRLEANSDIGVSCDADDVLPLAKI